MTSEIERLVSQYIRAMESDDVETVKRLSHATAALEYPGGLKFPSVEKLLEWSKSRHRGIRHVIEDIRVMTTGPDVVAYVDGTLRGTWMDGTTFEGIRFIYKFHVRDASVAHTRLWSDIADALLKKRAAAT
jgi:hypothetical protein